MPNPQAEKNGVYELNGVPYVVNAGDEYPEGATFRESDFPDATDPLAADASALQPEASASSETTNVKGSKAGSAT
jgi:hypothetical protein